MSPAPSAQIAGIYRYPVKGLSPEQLSCAALEPGQTLLADRRYAVENGPCGFDPAEPKWMPKPHFLMLQRDEWLAALRTHFDDKNNILTIRQNGAIAAQGDLETADGRAAIEQFFANQYAGEIKGPPKILTSPGHSFSDVARKVVSIINLASIAAIENMVGLPVHPLRFRANGPSLAVGQLESIRRSLLKPGRCGDIRESSTNGPRLQRAEAAGPAATPGRTA